MRSFILIITALVFSVGVSAQEKLTPDVVFLSYFKIKGGEIKKDDISAFLKRYYPKEFAQKGSDKAYIKEKVAYYNDQLPHFQYKKEYVLESKISITDYDNASQSWNSETEHYFSRGIINPSDKWGGTLDYVGKANNFGDYQRVPMDCAKVIDMFVNAAKVPEKTDIPVTISVSFYGAVNDEVNEFGSSKLFTGYVMCKVNKVTVHFSTGEDLVIQK